MAGISTVDEETGEKRPTDVEIGDQVAGAIREGRIRHEADVILFRDIYEAAPPRR